MVPFFFMGDYFIIKKKILTAPRLKFETNGYVGICRIQKPKLQNPNVEYGNTKRQNVEFSNAKKPKTEIQKAKMPNSNIQNDENLKKPGI